MRFDIDNFRFHTFKQYLEYTEGAAIGQATVFMTLLSAERNKNKYNYSTKDIDPYYYVKDLAIFCYLTHILRDVSIDLELEENGLIYIPLEDMSTFSVSEKDLWKFKRRKSINHNFRELMIFQMKRAREYQKKGEIVMSELNQKLDLDCRFILNLLISLYKNTMAKIEKSEYNVFNGVHRLNGPEIFQTTFQNARNHSFGKFRTLGLGLNLLYKAIKN